MEQLQKVLKLLPKNAESVAVDAKSIAQIATKTANDAVTVAGDAQSKAQNAVVAAQTAIESAQTAINVSSESQNIANEAKDEATNAYRKAMDAEQVASNVSNELDTVKGDLEETNNNVQTAQDTADNAKEMAENSFQLTSTTKEYQKIETGIVMGKAKKILLENAAGNSNLGMALNQYKELTDKATNAGLEQIELGTSKAIMCLNHCGAVFSDADGKVHTVDGHIRVDYKVKAGEKTIQDQLAYMSDIAELKEIIKILISHIQNVENSVFWIDPSTLKPTKEYVDPDTLTPLPSIE